MEESDETSTIPPNRLATAPKPSNGPWFTLDDIPKAKWPSRLQEFTAWIDIQMLKPGSSVQSVLREFSSRFLGSLRDWFDSLGQYRQLQFIQILDVATALGLLYKQLIGETVPANELVQK